MPPTSGFSSSWVRVLPCGSGAKGSLRIYRPPEPRDRPIGEGYHTRLILMSTSGASNPRNCAVRDGWPDLPDDQLLDVRFCELGLSIDASWLEARIAHLYEELGARGLSFRPHFWLSSEWFTPDGVPGVAIPFYLAHPRLMRLEKAQMLDVEGGTPEWCMQI